MAVWTGFLQTVGHQILTLVDVALVGGKDPNGNTVAMSVDEGGRIATQDAEVLEEILVQLKIQNDYLCNSLVNGNEVTAEDVSGER